MTSKEEMERRKGLPLEPSIMMEGGHMRRAGFVTTSTY